MCNSFNVRKLKASEIEVKPCQVAKDKSWVQCLLYKTSRVDMQVLTEMYGSKWKSDYKMVGDSLFCTISVWNDDLKDWIVRTDCGEKDAGISEEKSYATSAFKRAATQFGIGVELYSTPRIFINAKPEWFKGDKLVMTFYVNRIEWSGNDLMQLVICDRNGAKVYDFTEKPTENISIETKDNATVLKEFCSSMKGKTDTDQLKAFFNYYSQRIENGSFTGNINASKLFEMWMMKAKKAS